MKDWDSIPFVIFLGFDLMCESARFDSRILASCRSTVESLMLRLKMLRQENAEAAD